MRWLVLLVVVACSPKQLGSICGDEGAPIACGMPCDPAPGAPATCPNGLHCSEDGTCDAQCTPTGGQCPSDYTCTADGRCMQDPAGDGDAARPEYCKHIDVVIAVDNSSSMSQEKAALRDIAFPGFAQALITVAGGIDDFRVGVLDACPLPASYHTRGAGGPCTFQSGKVWMESTSTNLVDEFKCVGDIDSSGTMCSGSNDDEQPASTAAASLEPAYQDPGKSNAGFLRTDALLVVVAITDEDEQPVPSATAQQVYNRLVATKGDVKRMVFLGIGGAQACSNGAYGSAREAAVLRQVTDLFKAQGRGVFWDLCQGNLDQGLAAALATIDEACRDFGPIL